MKIKNPLAACACAALALALFAEATAAPAHGLAESSQLTHLTDINHVESTAVIPAVSANAEHGRQIDSVAVSQVPEPGTLGMLSLAVVGLIGISLYNRKRQ